MASLKLASSLTCVFLWKIALSSYPKSPHLHRQSNFISANVGDSVTLQCFHDEHSSVLFFWYKQTLGKKPQLVSSFYKHKEDATFSDEFRNTPRFSLDTRKGQNHLTITDLLLSDSATYYCISKSAYEFKFVEGITVSVKGSGLDIKVSIHPPESETIQPGTSNTQHCTIQTGTCEGQYSLYWFKWSEDSHPGLIYTHGGSKDQCETKPAAQTHTCVYNLPTKDLNTSDPETYYCAVASCGHILLRSEIKLEPAGKLDSPEFLVYLLTGALTFNSILTVLMAFAVCMMKKRLRCQHAAELHPRHPEATRTGPQGNEDEEHLHYAALRKQRFSQSRRERDEMSTHCVYSSVK